MSESVETRGDQRDELLAVDTNQDGAADVLAIDTDGNGKADLFQLDSDGDGAINVTMVDLDEDGSWTPRSTATAGHRRRADRLAAPGRGQMRPAPPGRLRTSRC